MTSTVPMIAGIPIVFGTALHVRQADRDPELYYYNIRHDDSGDGIAVEKHVLANHFGTIATAEPIVYLEEDNDNNQKWIDPNEDESDSIYRFI